MGLEGQIESGSCRSLYMQAQTGSQKSFKKSDAIILFLKYSLQHYIKLIGEQQEKRKTRWEISSAVLMEEGDVKRMEAKGNGQLLEAFRKKIKRLDP